jgi:hypothetical protein
MTICRSDDTCVECALKAARVRVRKVPLWETDGGDKFAGQNAVAGWRGSPASSRDNFHMEVELGVIADYALVDQTGKMSVLGIFDVTGAAAFPMVVPRLFVCIRLGSRPVEYGSRHKMRIVLQDADGASVGPTIDGEFVVAPQGVVQGAPKAYTQLVIALEQLAFQKPGTYSVELAIDAQHKHSIPLQVVKIGIPPAMPK